MGKPAKRGASYEDVLAAPPHKVAEIINDELVLSPRPAGPHSAAATALGEELGPPFKRGRGGPGGWIILYEPELHLGRDVLVPDLAGLHRDRLPALPEEAYFSVSPDWVCEVVSPSTAAIDRVKKLTIYARERLRHAWMINPIARTLEVLRLENGRWTIAATWSGMETVTAEPFDAIQLDLSLLWEEPSPEVA